MCLKRSIKYGCFLIFFMAYASTSPDLLPQKVKIEDGVRVVHNAKEGKWAGNPRLSLKLVRTIGGINVKDENQIFKNPKDIALDDDSCLYVLDQGLRRIQKFGPNSRFLATIGRQGQGPGEFMLPSKFDIDAQGRIYVNDVLKCKIFTPDGKEQKAIILPTSTLNGDIRIMKTGQMAIGGRIKTSWPGEKVSHPKLIEIFDGEGNLQKKFGEIRDYGKPLLNSHGNRFHFDVDGEGNFLISFHHQNRIEKYSPEGQLIWKADRVLNYSTKPLSEGLMSVSKYGRSTEAPNLNWVSFGIAADGKGRAWVITLIQKLNLKNFEEDYGRSDMCKLEVFDSDGILLQEIPLRHAVFVIRIQNNQLLLSDYSEAKILQYQIVEK